MNYQNDTYQFDQQIAFDHDDSVGRITARVAQLDVINGNRFMLTSGGLRGSDIVVSRWNHDSSPQLFGGNGNRPVGRGSISEDSKFLVANLEFDLAITDMRAEYDYLRFMKDQTRWSIGYSWNKADIEVKENKDGQYAKLTGYDVMETSPVLFAASPNTKTIATDSLITVDMIPQEVKNQIIAEYLLSARKER